MVKDKYIFTNNIGEGTMLNRVVQTGLFSH